MPTKEAKKYFEWLLGVQQSRIDNLELEVNNNPSFSNWNADYSPASLVNLGEWFATNIETRERTRTELASISSQLKREISFSAFELTDRTFSIAADIGLYLANVFIRNHPQINWSAPVSAKSSIDYRQPVLAGFNPPMNPIRLMITQAYSLANGKANGKIVYEIYKIWLEFILQRVTKPG